MSERKSLWGRYDCKVSEDGPVCTLCCLLLNVAATESPRNEPCKHQTEQGCSIHEDPEFSDECRRFHCSQISLNMWYHFYGEAARLGLISGEECKRLRKLLIIP